MEYLIIGLVTFFNLAVIKVKLEKKRLEDATLDAIILFTLFSITAGTYGGMVVGTVTSFCISLYFLVSPPTFFTGFFAEFKKRAGPKR